MIISMSGYILHETYRNYIELVFSMAVNVPEHTIKFGILLYTYNTLILGSVSHILKWLGNLRLTNIYI